MANYAKVGELGLRLLQVGGNGCAFDRARAYYAQHSGLNFEADFADYCRHGYVIVRPNLLGMVKPHRLENGSDAWHIQFVIGNLLELLTTLPCPLPYITFCRDNQTDRMRIVKWDRFQRLARRILNEESKKQTA